MILIIRGMEWGPLFQSTVFVKGFGSIRSMEYVIEHSMISLTFVYIG